jgi:drug/metabolite transporter (DMT)-like permease
MHAASTSDPYAATVLFRLCSVLVVAIAVAVKRPVLRLSGWRLGVVAAVGIGDATGNALFAASASAGGLVSLTSVLASLYPIVTVLLAAVFLKERVSLPQRIGVALTLGGVILIAA